MAIEKGTNTAPQGIEETAEGLDSLEQPLEIEIVNPDIVTLDDGSVEVSLVSGDALSSMLDAPLEFDANLAEYMDEDELAELSDDLPALVESDMDSRREWVDTYVEGLSILGIKYEERSEPWEGACGVNSTVLLESAIRFQADTMGEVFPAAGPVRTKILGKETKEKLDAAERVRSDMNYELTENMVEYRPEHERLLFNLGLSGSGFKKVYFDPTLGRQTAMFIPAEEVVVPYGASNIDNSPRVTHIMRKTKNDLKKLQSVGFYRDIDVGEPTSFHMDIEEKKAEEGGFTLSDDDRYTLFEIHADLVIEMDDSGDDIAKPYVITIEYGSGEVLSVRRNWEENDPLFLKRQHFVDYTYIPSFGFYGMGLIHIIGGYARAGTSLIRQLVDAGTLSNLSGGLKTRGLRIKGDDGPIGAGEWRDVDVPSGSIRDNIMPLPYKEPSQTLLTLLDRITNEGRRLGAINDMNISDMSANAPVGTTLALLERALKPMTAVQARVHFSMKKEFKLLKQVIAENAPLDYEYQPSRGEVGAKLSDYELVDVIPVSDPNSSTMAQRVTQYQAVLQMSQSAPQIYDLPQLHRQMIETLGIKNADKLVPLAEDALPADPVSENMNALMGTPMKAFLNQDHEAHIATHMAFMQDPMVAQTIGQNPQANQIMAALQAHIAEHAAFRYRKQIETKLGVTLPAPNEQLPEEVEIELSRLMSEAAKQNTQANQQQQAQQQAQQKMQDPLVQMQQQEMQMKQADLQRKAQKDMMDAQLKQAEIQRKAQKDMVDSQIKQKDLEMDQAGLALEAKRDGVDAGIKLNQVTNQAINPMGKQPK